MAKELIRQVPWMHRASVARIAWVVREVADASWSAEEIIAWLDSSDAPDKVHRPSGFLAQRLQAAVALRPDAAARARAVEAYRDSRRAAKARHVEWQDDWQPPRSESVRRLVDEAFAPKPQQHDGLGDEVPGPDGVEGPGEEELVELWAVAWGEYMAGDPTHVEMTLDMLGLLVAVRIYGVDLVLRVRKLAGGSSLMTVGHR